MIRRSKLFSALLVAGLLGMAGSAAAAEIQIINKDKAGVGLNDTTPATPVGGNQGTTRGQQAQIVFNFAAYMWGAVLKSTVPIQVDANFGPLQCDANGTVLGSTGTLGYAAFTDANSLPAGAKLNLWYPGALVNMYLGTDATPTTSDMSMSFNGALGTSTCLPDSGWYFGLDGNTPAGKSNLLNVMLHEMGHGLGFAGRSTLSSGALSGSRNDIYSSYAYGNTAQKYWGDMTNAQRKAAALDDGKLVFRGPNVMAEAPLALGPPPVLLATTPGGSLGGFEYAAASYGPAPTAQNFSGNVVVGISGADSQGCVPFDNAAAIAGHVAIVDRGTCSFQLKSVNAEAAGATAVILANNTTGVLTPGGDASYANPTIPTLLISQADGATLKQHVSDASVSLGFGSGLAGTDAAGAVLLYAPTTLASGSSFSHYDTRLSPNALMEYAESPDLKGHINLDLTPALFKDEGWQLNETGQMLLTCNTGVPTWIPGGIVIGANVYSNAKTIAVSAAHFGIYRTSMLAYAADLAAKQLISAPQATSLNACLSDAELHNQFNAWGNGLPDPSVPTGPVAVQLTNGVALGGQSGTAGGSSLYKLDVPAGALALTLRTLGGTGDVSLFVKVGAEPSETDNDFKSVHAGTNSESVAVSRPVAGTYYIKVVGVTAFSGVTVQGSFVQPAQ
ncbi:hypothetical protein B0E46_03245 [Rhodanobacter sp. B04]|uniref:PA domain-containing protein n=1 Tax=Rhodanobacter sp. B04 TaxID=1945860 RepID=UPI0009879748|nr:PA domain-containing protein [Rhodanobacter sp. B04]OOG65377.1 hypothetical protein B0E46_03245 [Rhodanobacter sp. B04]